MDRDKRDELNFYEFREIMHRRNLPINEIEIKGLFKRLDRDENGKISFEGEKFTFILKLFLN